MQVNHQEIAAKYLVGYIGILQHSTQTVNQHHAVGHFIGRFQCIDFAHSGRCKFNTRLLKLQVGRAPTVEQRIHPSDARAYHKPRKRCIGMPESNRKVCAIFCFCFQIKDRNSIEKLLYSIGRSHFIIGRCLYRIQNKIGHSGKILSWETSIHLFTHHMYFLSFEVIATGAVVLFALNHCNAQLLFIVFFPLWSTHVHHTGCQQAEKRIQLTPLFFCCFKCHLI